MTMKFLIHTLVILLLASHLGLSQISGDPEELLNWCIDSDNHKSKPSQEDQLHGQCSPWKERSCCTHSTTYKAHTTNMYNFDVDHCANVKPMSDKCKTHFMQDLCFFECEPNVGPWTAKVKMKTRRERFYKVPLCASDCDVWFNACRDDYTCTDNWMLNFRWKDGKNLCPSESTCRKFSDIYRSSAEFCEKVWDYSWKYTPDTMPCMRIWFNGTVGNPNEQVARLRVEELEASWSSGARISGSLGFVLFVTLLIRTSGV